MHQGEDVEEFLNKANIADVIFSMNDAVLKETIFICMKKFERFPNIHLRSIQLLQDVQVLSSRGISSDELNNRFDHLIQPLSLYIDRVDIVVNLFELLAMVADRKSMKNKCAKTEGDNCLLGYISQALSVHVNERAVQRAGLQLYEAILNNANDKSQKKMARDIFKAVVNNLASTNDDPTICYSSYSILCTLAEKMGDKLSTWMDRILGMLLTTISQLFSAELVARCIQLLEKIALSTESLYVISAHPRCLLVFTDALSVLEPKHLGVCITILEYLVKLLEDDTSLTIASENIIEQGEDEVQYFVDFRALFRSRTQRYFHMLGDYHYRSDIDSAAIDYYQQLVDECINLLNAILGGSDDPPVGKTKAKHKHKQQLALIESIVNPTDSLETIVEEDASNDEDGDHDHDGDDKHEQERPRDMSNQAHVQDQSVGEQAVGWSNLDLASHVSVVSTL